MSCEVSSLRVVEARPEQAGEIAAVITEAAIRRKLHFGLNDWEIPFPEELVEESIEIGTVLAGRLVNEAVATVTLNDSDLAIWGEQPPDSLYVSKFALLTEVHGRGIGSLMLAGADRQAAAAGKSYLRLECNNSNSGLRQYYAGLGFKTKGTKRMGCCYTAARYERAVRP